MGVQECVNSIENGCNSNEEEEERGNSSEELLLGGGGVKRTLHRSPSSVLRKKSDPMLLVPSKKDGFGLLAQILANVQEVILGTKLFVLFPAVFLAILAQCNQFGRHWVFALSLLGLAPLAERISFLTEQIAFYTGPTVGGLLNATCGNATELIIAVLALHQNKILVVKFSLLGSILSNLLLVLGTSLLCGGLVNIKKQQTFCRKQADVNSLMLLLGLLCHMLPLILRYAVGAGSVSDSNLVLSRASGIVMLVAYLAYLFFQLKTHRQLFDSEEGDEDEDEKAVVGFWSAFGWLLCMTVLTALLSEYVVGTIEDASESWGLSVRFISLIVLPIVGNAAEHAGAIIFAFKNKLDISMGVALGSATQVSMFVVPFSVLVGWVMGVQMDLDFSVLETGCLAFSVLLTALALQDGTSHYMKGVILCLCYAVIGTCYFFERSPFLKGQKAM